MARRLRNEGDSGGGTTLAQGFPPLARADAHSLILGSMPGQASLRQARYYAHPRNAFWPIVSQCLGLAADAGYAPASDALLRRGFALWDVLARCERPGSLDADIRPESIEANDFAAFFAAHPHIGRVLFNGAAAQALYRRHVLPALPAAMAALPQLRMPSTSPAHAGMSRHDKALLWQRALAPG